VKIFLAGATGFIGTALVRALAERGDDCVVLSRGERNPWPGLPVRLVRGNPTVAGRWEKEVAAADAVVNLVGELIVDPLHRWTDHRKRALRASRLDATRNLVSAIRAAGTPPAVLVSASGINYYGARGDDIVTEETPPGTDFLAGLCVDWEAAAREAGDRTRVALLRSAPVFGKGGGGLAPLIWLFRLGLGGVWGDGRQWWSWVHLADEVGLILHVLDHPLAGPVNLAAPNPVTVKDLAQAMGRALHRPTVLRAPEFALRLALGEAADAILHYQRVVPKRALETGYRFRFAAIDPALAEAFS
jgi:uncharacterized protein (TIGR01777 family)